MVPSANNPLTNVADLHQIQAPIALLPLLPVTGPSTLTVAVTSLKPHECSFLSIALKSPQETRSP